MNTLKVSIEDAPLLLNYEWRESHDGYAMCGKLRLHRLILDAQPGQIIDHRDGDKMNNTRDNLRFCTHAQNMQNSKVRSHSSTGVKGVQQHRHRYRARIRINGAQVTLGTYTTLAEAKAVYDAKALEIFGEFARYY